MYTSVHTRMEEYLQLLGLAEKAKQILIPTKNLIANYKQRLLSSHKVILSGNTDYTSVPLGINPFNIC